MDDRGDKLQLMLRSLNSLKLENRLLVQDLQGWNLTLLMHLDCTVFDASFQMISQLQLEMFQCKRCKIRK